MYKITLTAKRINEDTPFIYQSPEGERYITASQSVREAKKDLWTSYDERLSENGLDYIIDFTFVNEQAYQKYLAALIIEYPDFMQHRAEYFSEKNHELYMFVTNEDGTHRTGKLC